VSGFCERGNESLVSIKCGGGGGVISLLAKELLAFSRSTLLRGVSAEISVCAVVSLC